MVSPERMPASTGQHLKKTVSLITKPDSTQSSLKMACKKPDTTLRKRFARKAVLQSVDP